MAAETLVEILDAAVAQRSSHPAVVDPGVGEISYGELAALAGQLETRLRRLGVGRGDRVGLCLSKSIDAVAGIWGILRTGAAYVPIDADAPAWRGAYILNDCSVKAVLLERRLADSLGAELERLGPRPAFLELPGVGGGDGLRGLLGQEPAGSAAGAGSGERPDPDDLAYILYTSGSTGKPKGVMLTHRNALSFVAWCSDTFQPRPEDRFASHAPFHFDLSILDLYVSFRHGATLVLVGSDTGKQPLALADLLAESAISIWYSAPSILGMLAQFGKLERHRYPALRMVLFAGEVFPVKHLRALKAQLPGPRYFNLYGPTETNVCTWFEIPAVVPEERTTPYPIGKVCPQLRGRVLDQAGQAVPAGGGVAGELCIAGPNVMQGYWNLPERTAEAFLVDGSGARWYRTGDLVVRRKTGISFLAVAGTGWSSAGVIASSSRRSKRVCTVMPRSRRRPWWPTRTRPPGCGSRRS